MNENIDWKRRDVGLVLKEIVVGECNGLIWLRAGYSQHGWLVNF
jgi:hypothetical protein